MFLLEDELQYEGDIDYEKSLFELAACYDCGAVMERKVFSYDAENQQWLEGMDLKPEAEKELEKIPRTGDAYWFFPYRWTVEARETGVVAVSLQLYMADVREGEVKSLQDTEWLIECDFKGSSVRAWPMGLLQVRQRGWVGAFSCSTEVTFPHMLGAYSVEIPTEVTETAIAFMQEMAEEEFGFRPTYLGNIHGLDHMLAYCVRPLDLNIHLLRDLIGDDYENAFPREQRDNYRPLCRFFHLANPPKSLRKVYGEGAENFVAYLLFRQLGFRDINVIRRFFHRDRLFGYRLLELKYEAEEAKLKFRVDNEEARYLLWLERFCQWFLRHRRETQLANCLHPLAVQEDWEQHAIDILRMFAVGNFDQVEAALSADIRRCILREGFTQNVHDLLMEELPQLRPQRRRGWGEPEPVAPVVNEKIQYTDKELKYAEEREGYRIILPKDTDEIRKYGKAFHNCVGGYSSGVVEKRTLILAMKKGEKYVACLEVRQNRLVQALGPCNQILSDEIGEVLCRWADEKKIAYRKRR